MSHPSDFSLYPWVHPAHPIQLPEELLHKTFKSIRLLRNDCAPSLSILASGLTVRGNQGFRSVRASHGVCSGTFYYEAYWHPSPALPGALSVPADPACPRPIHIAPSIESLSYPSTSAQVPTEAIIRTDALPDAARLSTDPTVLRAQDPHLRIGFGTTSDLNFPVGHDLDSFGYRDVNGQKVSSSITESYGEAFRPGDIIGCLIHFPELNTIHTDNSLLGQEDLAKIIQNTTVVKIDSSDGSQHGESGSNDDSVKIDNIIVNPSERSLSMAYNSSSTHVPIMNPHLHREILSYQSSLAHKHPKHNSYIEFFKNGNSQGIAFTGLVTDKLYFPQISVFQHATVTCNFGPDFAYPPPKYTHQAFVQAPLSEPDFLTPQSVYARILSIDAFYRVALHAVYRNIPTYDSIVNQLAQKPTSKKRGGLVRVVEEVITQPQTPYGVLNASLFGEDDSEHTLEHKLQYLLPQPNSYYSQFNYHAFPLAATTAYALRLGVYYYLEKKLLRQTVIQRFLMLFRARYNASLQLPESILHDYDLNGSFAPLTPPSTKTVLRHRLVFLPHLHPNPRGKEIELSYDDVIVPTSHPSYVLDDIAENISHFQDPNLHHSLSLRFANVKFDELTGTLIQPAPGSPEFELFQTDLTVLLSTNEVQWINFLSSQTHHKKSRQNAKHATDTAYHLLMMSQNIEDKLAQYKEALVTELRNKLKDFQQLNKQASTTPAPVPAPPQHVLTQAFHRSEAIKKHDFLVKLQMLETYALGLNCPNSIKLPPLGEKNIVIPRPLFNRLAIQATTYALRKNLREEARQGPMKRSQQRQRLNQQVESSVSEQRLDDSMMD